QLLIEPALGFNCRFCGSEFPPVIVFKIFHHRGGSKYFSGSAISPASEAASDACRMMGRRAFFSQLRLDNVQRARWRIVDVADVTCAKDYMQYNSHLDETPACLGGRENTWRTLSLEGLRRTPLACPADPALLGALWHNKAGPNQPGTPQQLSKTDWSVLFARRRVSVAVTCPCLRRSPAVPPSSVASARRPGPRPVGAKPSSRRSSRARHTAAKMRDLYSLQRDRKARRAAAPFSEDEEERASPRVAVLAELQDVIPADIPGDEARFSEEEWEEEAERLCSWTKQLSLDDLGMASAACTPEKI
ncbi:CX058 protein, partial [Atractosteus spatula]|nr:CX058 protein [Atractosteus spatula]